MVTVSMEFGWSKKLLTVSFCSQHYHKRDGHQPIYTVSHGEGVYTKGLAI